MTAIREYRIKKGISQAQLSYQQTSGARPTVFDEIKAATAQKINDTLPKCTDLTLENPTVLIAFDESEAGTGGRF